MEFKEETKRHIERVTGVPFDKLIETEDLKPDARLLKFRQRFGSRVPISPPFDTITFDTDPTVTPWTSMEEIDAYWDKQLAEYTSCPTVEQPAALKRIMPKNKIK